MSKRAPDTAEIIQTLLWYDEPEILLLKKSAKEYIIAVASPDPIEGVGAGCPFIGASLTEKNVRDYQEEKCDLRFAMSHAMFGRFWAFAYDGEDAQVTLSRYSMSSEIVRSALPDSGFFARAHDRIESVDEFVSDAEVRFDIDGSWDLGEFSSFYGKMEDIYYIANDIRRFNDDRTKSVEKSDISQAFKKPWRGGGSYVSYYQDIANDNPQTARLKVGGIQYNSPGFVKIAARKRPFDDMISMLQCYSKNSKEIKDAYNQLHKYLSSHGLLKASSDTDTRPVIAQQIEIYASTLTKIMALIPFNTLREMTEGNTVVAAKVQLSIFRRLERLYEYFAQGRVSYESLCADPAANG